MLAVLLDRFRYLKVGLAAVLVFVGSKMLIMDWYKMPPAVSLAVILGMFGLSVWFSLAASKREALEQSKTTPTPGAR